jgi:hypothetical protein
MKMTHDNIQLELERLATVRIGWTEAMEKATSDRHIHAHRLKQLDIRIAMLRRQLPKSAPAPEPVVPATP